MRLGAAARLVPAVVMVIATAWFAPSGVHVVLLFGPLLLVVLPLVCGRYPGEERIARLVRARRSRRRPRAAARTPRRSRPALRPVPRGGRLIACSLAVRPPPVVFGVR
jgi:hypothetical protein